MKTWSAGLCQGPFSFSIRLFTTANDPAKGERRNYLRAASRQAPAGSIPARVSWPDGANFSRRFSARSNGTCPQFFYSLDRRRILEGREIAEIRLTEIGAANHAAENLGVPGLGEIGHEAHGLRPQRPAKFFRNGVPDLTRQCVGRLVTWPQHGEHDDRLALELVRHADRRRFEHRGMSRRRRFDLRGPDALARHLERVVTAALDEPEAVTVDARPVSVHPDVRKPAPVRRQILLRIAPEPARHARPWLANDELAHRAAQRAAARVRHIGGDPGHGARKGRGLEWCPRRAAQDPAGD